MTYRHIRVEREGAHALLWVTDFPMFEANEVRARVRVRVCVWAARAAGRAGRARAAPLLTRTHAARRAGGGPP